MIAFGCSITRPEVYEHAAGPGIRLVAEPDSQVHARLAAGGSIYRNYNLLLDLAAAHEDLEALVLLHQDAEIVDPGFCAKVRAALADADVGVVGCVGAVGVRSIAWWEGSVTWASFVHRYSEHGGGDLPGFSWGAEKPAYAETGEVDTVDGFVLVLSPWVVRNVRFDEALGALHGYDFDFCLSVREAGRKVVTADFKVVHHHSLELVSEPETWAQAHMAIAEKWDGRMPGVGAEGGDWHQRARRAEADAAVSRAQLETMRVQTEAMLAEMTTSLSWRMTAPLRWLSYGVRQLRSRRAAPGSRRP